MLRFFFLIVINLFSNLSFSQKVNIKAELSRTNELARLIRNHLLITVEGYNCKQIRVKVDKGKIIGEGCNYYYKIIDSCCSDVKVIVGVKQLFKTKWIDTSYLKIKELPDPYLYFGMHNNGDTISKATIQISPRFAFPNRLYHTFEFVGSTEEVVISYSLKIIRKDSILFNEDVLCDKHPCFNDSAFVYNGNDDLEYYETEERDLSKGAFYFICNDTKSGDKIVFDNVVVRMYKAEERNIGKLVLILK